MPMYEKFAFSLDLIRHVKNVKVYFCEFKFIYFLLPLESRRHDHDLTARLRARRTPTALHGHDVCLQRACAYK